MDEQQLERALASKAVAPRVTLGDVNGAIVRAEYWNPEGTTLTVCVLHLKNGFCVTGESASASPENYNKDIGESLAFDKAKDKIWALEGYALRCRLAATTDPEGCTRG